MSATASAAARGVTGHTYRDTKERPSMSDFDRNVAARGFGGARATAIDAGLRAYMIRVYNYMASGVALTGVVAWLTYNTAVVTDAAGKITGLTPFGQAIFGGPLTIVLFLGTLGIVFFMSFRINKIDHPHVLHLGGVVWRVEPLRLHHAARSLAGRVIPGD